MPSGNRVEVRYASTLKQGLEDFFTEYLKPKGFLNKKIVGNMMMVQRGKGAKEYTFVAYEEAPPKAKR